MVSRYALKWIREARAGDPDAQLWLGKLYLRGGEGMARNVRAALHWLTLAANAGLETAAVLVAEEVPESVGVESQEYGRLVEQAAALGSSLAHSRIGDLKAGSDPQKAVRGYYAAAKQGHMEAARKLGVLLQRHPELVPAAGEDARYWLELAANAGDLSATQSLAEMLWHSRDSQAPTWLEVIARTGDVDAMYRLGAWLAEGHGTEDSRQGAYWLEAATRKGHARAMWLYGRMHAKSLFPSSSVVPNSIVQAARLLERAAALGLPEALYDLSRIYAMQRYSGRDLRTGRRPSLMSYSLSSSLLTCDRLHCPSLLLTAEVDLEAWPHPAKGLERRHRRIHARGHRAESASHGQVRRLRTSHPRDRCARVRRNQANPPTNRA
jgi:TPR repeat protein